MEKQTLLDKLGNINEQLNLTHYWIIFLKYKKLLFVLPIFFGLLGYLVALNIKPVFQSNATLVIEADNKKIVDIDEVYAAEGQGGFRNNFNHINNQMQIMQSDEIINGVLSNEEKTLSELMSVFPKTIATPETRFDVLESRKFLIIDEIKDRLSNITGQVIDIDGIRVENELGWFLIRASNTQNQLTCRAEALNQKDLIILTSIIEEQLLLSGVNFKFIL